MKFVTVISAGVESVLLTELLPVKRICLPVLSGFNLDAVRPKRAKTTLQKYKNYS